MAPCRRRCSRRGQGFRAYHAAVRAVSVRRRSMPMHQYPGSGRHERPCTLQAPLCRQFLQLRMGTSSRIAPARATRRDHACHTLQSTVALSMGRRAVARHWLRGDEKERRVRSSSRPMVLCGGAACLWTSRDRRVEFRSNQWPSQVRRCMAICQGLTSSPRTAAQLTCFFCRRAHVTAGLLTQLNSRSEVK